MEKQLLYFVVAISLYTCYDSYIVNGSKNKKSSFQNNLLPSSSIMMENKNNSIASKSIITESNSNLLLATAGGKLYPNISFGGNSSNDIKSSGIKKLLWTVETTTIVANNTNVPTIKSLLSPLKITSNIPMTAAVFNTLNTTGRTVKAVNKTELDHDPHAELSKQASTIVGLGFIPGIILLFIFCRYVPEWFAKVTSNK